MSRGGFGGLKPDEQARGVVYLNILLLPRKLLKTSEKVDESTLNYLDLECLELCMKLKCSVAGPTVHESQFHAAGLFAQG